MEFSCFPDRDKEIIDESSTRTILLPSIFCVADESFIDSRLMCVLLLPIDSFPVNGSDHEEKQPLNCTQSDLYVRRPGSFQTRRGPSTLLN